VIAVGSTRFGDGQMIPHQLLWQPAECLFKLKQSKPTNPDV